jgi:predicted naringenin-chalcone synthase
VLAQVPRERIGSFVTATCTGYDTPSPDILLAAEFGLPRQLRRTFVGHVGCHAAFAAIKVAMDALAARPDQLALVQCIEVCSVHVRTAESTPDQIVSQALFGDAGAALVMGTAAGGTGPEILHAHTETVAEHHGQLCWSIGDDGFRMTLAPTLPFTIARAVRGFVDDLLSPLQLRIGDIAHWGIHPGGPKIVELVAQALLLRPEQAAPSLAALAEHGNCSSATILLILERLLKQQHPAPGTLGVLLGFGPGLTLEGLVLRF